MTSQSHESKGGAPDTASEVGRSCEVFDTVAAPQDGRDVILRFVVGQDPAPRPMSPEEADNELNDPLATLVLRKGTFPRTASELLAAVDEATPNADPLRDQMSFVLGEGGQVPWSADTAALDRAMRFLVTRGSGSEGPDLLVSARHPEEGMVEVMGWDRESGGFNYYRTIGGDAAWVWAGNSRHALSPPTKGKGPFESHTSGNFVMKELRAPWVHWHSPDANIFPHAFPDQDMRRRHQWFAGKETADVCEAAVALPSITRWTKARFSRMIAADGKWSEPRRVLEQILATPTVNLISSHTESRAAAEKGEVHLPQTFFLDSQALCEILKLKAPPPPPGDFKVEAAVYLSSLETFDFTMRGSGGFAHKGDTHFAFVVPERAVEDNAVLREALRIGLITPRLAACLLMVDFPNPIFSSRRALLLAHVPGSATIKDGTSGFSEEMAARILEAAGQAPEHSPEREFVARWDTGNDWQERFSGLLEGYYAAVTERLKQQSGFDDYVRLAESRRARLRKMPLFENTLLLPDTNIAPQDLMMRPDATVGPTEEVP